MVSFHLKLDNRLWRNNDSGDRVFAMLTAGDPVFPESD
jgi:hypothetical protein